MFGSRAPRRVVVPRSPPSEPIPAGPLTAIAAFRRHLLTFANPLLFSRFLTRPWPSGLTAGSTSTSTTTTTTTTSSSSSRPTAYLPCNCKRGRKVDPSLLDQRTKMDHHRELDSDFWDSSNVGLLQERNVLRASRDGIWHASPLLPSNQTEK